jgi:16S rRNA processing protein RimM
MADEYISIGHTKKTHGAAGEIKVVIEDRFLEDFAQTDVVFINILGKPAPFFIEDVRVAGDLLLKLEEIDTPAQAKTLTSSEIFLRKQDLLHVEDEDAPPSTFKIFEGYEIEDEKMGKIGKIIEVVDLPQQELAVVEYEGREVMIPLHPDLIKKIDKKTGTIILNLPDGILDL